MITLENEQIKATFSLSGAELIKLYSKETKLDYLWNGNPDFWKRHAPILFPIVGKLKDNSYLVDNKTFHLSQHGFARDNEFTLVSQSKTELVFELSFSEKTLAIYPYKFRLLVAYRLEKNKLETSYKVENVDNKPIFFSIGAHPAFKCPITEETSFSDYFIEFEKDENPLQFSLNKENGLRIETPTEKQLPKELSLNYNLFIEDALIYKNITSKVISLKSKKHKHGINFECSDWEYVAFWTVNKAPFMCFEPWMGAADLETTNQDFTTKDGIIELDINKEFKQRYVVTLF